MLKIHKNWIRINLFVFFLFEHKFLFGFTTLLHQLGLINCVFVNNKNQPPHQKKKKKSLLGSLIPASFQVLEDTQVSAHYVSSRLSGKTGQQITDLS